MNPLFQTLATTVLSTLTQGQSGATGNANQTTQLISAVVSMFSQSNSAEGAAAGLQGLLSKFQQSGLDDVVASWVGTGANKEISADHVQQAFGAEQIGQLAQQFGMDKNSMAGQLASMLPNLVNQLTPEGKVDNNLINQVLGAVMGATQKAA